MLFSRELADRACTLDPYSSADLPSYSRSSQSSGACVLKVTHENLEASDTDVQTVTATDENYTFQITTSPTRKYRVLLALFVHLKITSMSPSNFMNPEAFFHSFNHRKKRYVTYTPGTAIGLLVAIALPVEVPEENLYFSLNFEANYNLPDNITQYYNSDIAKALHAVTRRSTYNLIQNQLDGQGYHGEECLLRLICEASNYYIPEAGLVESIFHIIFKPSRSINESLPEKYHRAEQINDCEREYPRCVESLLDLFSQE